MCRFILCNIPTIVALSRSRKKLRNGEKKWKRLKEEQQRRDPFDMRDEKSCSRCVCTEQTKIAELQKCWIYATASTCEQCQFAAKHLGIKHTYIDL